MFSLSFPISRLYSVIFLNHYTHTLVLSPAWTQSWRSSKQYIRSIFEYYFVLANWHVILDEQCALKCTVTTDGAIFCFKGQCYGQLKWKDQWMLRGGSMSHSSLPQSTLLITWYEKLTLETREFLTLAPQTCFVPDSKTLTEWNKKEHHIYQHYQHILSCYYCVV